MLDWSSCPAVERDPERHGAQFVRLKVYVGAMVKAEGILEGLAYAAIQYRAHDRSRYSTR